jgi:hypothetical protein
MKKAPPQQKNSVNEFIRSALGSTKREPGWEYGNILPVRMRKNEQGEKEREWGLGYSNTAKGMLDAFTLPRRAMEGEEVTPEQAMEMAMNVSAPGVATARYAPGVLNMPIVYHGGPHKFPPTPDNPLGEFDASKIGSGAGGQSYSHGVYVAQNPKVSQFYKDTAGIGSQDMPAPDDSIAADLGSLNFLPDDIDEYYDLVKSSAEKIYFKNGKITYEFNDGSFGAFDDDGQFKAFAKPESFLYTADLPDEMVDRMLDWDKPLSEQPEAIRKALANIQPSSVVDGTEVVGGGVIRIKNDPDFGPKYFLEMDGESFRLSPEDVDRLAGENRGESFYRSLMEKFGGGKPGEIKASEYLRALGIPGIKYLDEFSRGAGEGTRNFVLFPGEEKKAKIIKRE